MTYDEIVAAGINPAANQHVYKFKTELTFVAGVKPYEFSIESYYDPEYNFLGSESGGFSTIKMEYEDGIETDVSVGIFPCERFVLIIYGEAHWLKEIYQVELLVYNMSTTDSLSDITATLELPTGLSLANMNSGSQSASIPLGNLAEAEINNGTTSVSSVSANGTSAATPKESILYPLG